MSHLLRLPLSPCGRKVSLCGGPVSPEAKLLCALAHPGGHLPPAGPLPGLALLVILLVVGSPSHCIFYLGLCTVQTVFLVYLSSNIYNKTETNPEVSVLDDSCFGLERMIWPVLYPDSNSK